MDKHTFFFSEIGYIYKPEVRYYCMNAPFDLPKIYPELPFILNKDESNEIYPMVRELLIRMELDKEHAGIAAWNPFKGFIRPGDKVLIKPNLVTHHHYLGKDSIISTLVHGSVIRPIIDYVNLALKGEGSITIADNPIEPANFEEIMSASGIKEMVEALNESNYKNLNVLDLRPKIINKENIASTQRKPPGDPLGYTTIDLGKDSCFAEFDYNGKISYYTLEDKTIDHLDPYAKKKSKTDDYHNSEMHKYIISKSVLDSDVIINVAKLKTHCKSGVTLALKNLIGIVSAKVCMPHHRPGPPPEGDAFPDYPDAHYVESRKIYSHLRRMLKIHKLPGVKDLINTLRKNKILVGQHIEHGNWKGNDTIWRTILDINRIALYADKNGVMKDTPQRRFFSIIDGIIGQQGDAPISGEPIQCGIILGGYNPVILDAFATKIMGIDIDLIKTITKAKELKKWPLCPADVDLSLLEVETPNLNFRMPKGWR